jgi:hypothetical protein
MLNIPTSWAMDAALPGGGPGTSVLPSIGTARPEEVLKYALALASGVSRLASLFGDLGTSQQALRAAWPAAAGSDSAAAALTRTQQTFGRIATSINQATTELDTAAKWIQASQAAYRAIVSGTNPTVAALLSNPTTRPHASAVAGAATGGCGPDTGGAAAPAGPAPEHPQHAGHHHGGQHDPHRHHHHLRHDNWQHDRWDGHDGQADDGRTARATTASTASTVCHDGHDGHDGQADDGHDGSGHDGQHGPRRDSHDGRDRHGQARHHERGRHDRTYA